MGYIEVHDIKGFAGEMRAKKVILATKSEKIESILKELEKFTGNDDVANSNYESLPISTAELELLKQSLTFLLISKNLPRWSQGVVFHANGALAVIKSFRGLIPNPIKEAYNGLLDGLKIPDED